MGALVMRSSCRSGRPPRPLLLGWGRRFGAPLSFEPGLQVPLVVLRVAVVRRCGALRPCGPLAPLLGLALRAVRFDFLLPDAGPGRSFGDLQLPDVVLHGLYALATGLLPLFFLPCLARHAVCSRLRQLAGAFDFLHLFAPPCCLLRGGLVAPGACDPRWWRGAAGVCWEGSNRREPALLASPAMVGGPTLAASVMAGRASRCCRLACPRRRQSRAPPKLARWLAAGHRASVPAFPGSCPICWQPLRRWPPLGRV